jgi:caffeoyl-CoA O-methyltransferase
MKIVEPDLDLYCSNLSDNEPEVLKQITRDTFVNVLKPRMLSGKLQGRLLSMISKILAPKYILEIGTFTGYSAICLAEGLIDNGKLYTIEANEEYKERILYNIKLAHCEQKIELIIGEAIKEIKKINIKFDLVFIDADKLNYIKYYDEVFSKLNIGGLIISDNVLWDGKVYDNTKNDATTQLLREYNNHLKNDPRTEKVLLPIRDGLFVSRKIKEL